MTAEDGSRLSSGIPGLDEVLHGGFLPERTYMIRGTSGTGKTIVGYHFLTAGVAAGEEALFVAFEEAESDLRANARQLGFDLSGVTVLDLSPSPEYFLDEEAYTVFGPSEVEGRSLAGDIGEAVEDLAPDRVFVDPLTQLRHLSPDEYQFNRTAASLMSYLKREGVTTLFTSQPTTERSDDDLQYLCDGAVTLHRSPEGRSLTVDKFRGSDFQGGLQDVRIDGTGISVFPKLVPESHGREFAYETISSGVDELDALLGGGIERGSVTLISGPSGVGKSTTGTAFARAAAARGERAAIYLFEESEASFRHRSEAIGIPVDEMVEAGDLRLHEVEPLTVSAGEFAHGVREEVEKQGAELVMVDGVSGYRMALRNREDELRAELHALARYLRNMGVTVLLADEIQEVTGTFQASDAHVSYLADNILFIRYIEVGGEIRKAVGVLKKRLGDFETTLRAFRIGDDGIHVGEPLTGLRGVLTGTPTATNDSDG